MVAAVAVVVATLAAGPQMAAAAPSPLPAITASSHDSFMHDTAGRVRLFHGVNGVHKAAPWYPGWLLNETLVEELESWGVNVIRVGWLFNGLMPAENFVNETYFQEQQRVVEMLASHGIYALLDAHQDVLSSRFCLYDAWPRWLIDRSVSEHPFPWPLKGNCSSRAWGANEITEAAATCYGDIFNNRHGMRDAYAKFWAESAARWAGNTNVLGYELMNEPFAGDVYADPLLWLPGVAGQKNLQPFYHVLADAIRPHDDEHIIMYEPTVWGMVGTGTIAGSGFTQVPGGPTYANRSVFSYHAYCASFGGNRALCDDIVMPLVFDAVRKDVATTGGSSFLTEWGGCDSSNVGKCQDMARLADEHLQSWTEYGGFGQGGPQPDQSALDVIIRAYGRAYAGTPLNMTFNTTTLAFETCWRIDTAVKAPTVVFVPLQHRYGGPTGASVRSTPNLAAKLDAGTQQLLVTPVTGGANGEVGCVWVAKAQATT